MSSKNWKLLLCLFGFSCILLREEKENKQTKKQRSMHEMVKGKK